MGWHAAIVVHSDATAAIGVARRKGLGHIWHLDITDLWIQDKIRSQIIPVAKVLSTKNMADGLTTYVDKASLASAMSRIHIIKSHDPQSYGRMNQRR